PDRPLLHLRFPLAGSESGRGHPFIPRATAAGWAAGCRRGRPQHHFVTSVTAAQRPPPARVAQASATESASFCAMRTCALAPPVRTCSVWPAGNGLDQPRPHGTLPPTACETGRRNPPRGHSLGRLHQVHVPGLATRGSNREAGPKALL